MLVVIDEEIIHVNIFFSRNIKWNNYATIFKNKGLNTVMSSDWLSIWLGRQPLTVIRYLHNIYASVHKQLYTDGLSFSTLVSVSILRGVASKETLEFKPRV